MSLLNQASLIITPNKYKEGKLYSVIPNTDLGDMDVVRATAATRVNELGVIENVGLNIPRIDYTNGGCPSILVEPQRTNLLTYSDQFDNVSWIKNSLNVTANNIISPDGNITADKIVENTNDAPHWIAKSITGTYTTLTISCYMKKGERNWGIIRTRTTVNDFYAWFNLDNGTVGTVQSGITASITDVGNGWYRCVVINPNPTTLANPSIIGVSNANSVFSYTGNGTSGIFIWGAQLEQGAYATSYIPTVASTVTRNADVISKTGISSLIGQTEGTLFVDFKFTNVGTEKYIISVTDILATNAISMRRLSTGEVRMVLSATTLSGTSNASSVVLPNGNYKLAYKYISGSLKLFINGALSFSLIPTFTFGTPLSIVRLGMDTANSIQLGDSINSTQLYKTALTDEQCILLTGDTYDNYNEMATNLNYILQ